MVHEDTEEVPVPTGTGYGDQSHASDDIWYQAVLRMTQVRFDDFFRLCQPQAN